MLLPVQRHDRVYAHRAARRNEAAQDRGGRKHKGGRHQTGWIGRRDLDQHRFENTCEGQRTGQTDDHADC